MANTPMLSVVAGAAEALLGALLQDSTHLNDVRAILEPYHFEDVQLASAYQALCDTADTGEAVNPLTVAERMEKNGTLAAFGGLPRFADLIGATVAITLPNLQAHARILIKEHDRGKLRRLGLRLVDAADSRTSDPADIASLVVSFAKGMTVAANAQPQQLILDVAQLHERHKSQQWAVKGYIPQNALGMFFGASGTFKSFVALDYALHRAYGLPWLGRRTRKGIPVYIAAEGGAGLMRRVEAWHRQRGLDWRQCHMRFVITAVQLTMDGTKLREAIDDLGVSPSDIIVDTMSQTFGGEENSSTEVAAYLSHLGASLREPYGATVIVVHHTGHQATERPRGSSAILANVDFLYGVFRDDKEPVATMECIKQKDGDRAQPISFALKHIPLGRDEDGDEISSLAARHLAGADEIIAAAAESKGPPSALVRLLNAIATGAPEEEVRDRFYKSMPESDTDARRQAFYRALKRAEGQGIVVREGDWLQKVAGNGA